MPEPTVFLRLLAHEGNEAKAAALAEAIAAVREGRPHNPVAHLADPQSFRQIPGSPFAYWVSECILRLFTALPPFEGEGRTARVGLQTGDDFRFVRAWWEMAPARILDGARGPHGDLAAFQAWCRRRTHEGKRWAPFAKGGAYSPFYADIHLVVNWEDDGEEMKAFPGAVIRNPDYYFRPGLTWPRRTSGLSFRVLPAGCVFGDKGPAGFAPDDDPHSILPLLAMLNTRAFYLLVEALVARVALAQSFEVGIIQAIPVRDVNILVQAGLADMALSCVLLKRDLDRANETSHAFHLPALLQVRGADLSLCNREHG